MGEQQLIDPPLKGKPEFRPMFLMNGNMKISVFKVYGSEALPWRDDLKDIAGMRHAEGQDLQLPME